MISFSRWTLSSGWQTAADYSSAAPLEWIVYRELSSREQKHARAKSGRVQRGGTFCVHNEQRLLNLFNTHGLQEERLLCSSTQLSADKYLLSPSALTEGRAPSWHWHHWHHGRASVCLHVDAGGFLHTRTCLKPGSV